jgi:hypothetical protein
MNRYRTLSLAISMTMSTLPVPVRAANKPRAGNAERAAAVWTNQDLERLRFQNLISIVGQPARAEDATAVALPSHYVKTQDPEWYGKQAATLRDELERRQAQFREYRQALGDARSLREMTGGINLDEGDVGITPDAGLEILQQQVNQTQMELDALEDLARRNDIPSGSLRGR